MKRYMGKIAFLLLSLVLISGCAGWRPVREVEVVEPPPQFEDIEHPESFTNEPWWTLLGDETLTGYIEKALQDNLTLEQQLERVKQSRSILTAARASLIPSLSASGSYSTTDVLEESSIPNPSPNAPDYPITTYSGAVIASYELDLFGRITAMASGAKADYLATRYGTEAMILATSAQVAGSYYAIVELRQQLELVEKTVKSYEAYLDLVRERYKMGVTGSIDVYQAKQNLSGVLAQKESLEAGLYAAENSFSILLGEYPKQGIIPEDVTIPEEFNEINIGLPSELLKRRPDVQSAYYLMVSADRSAAQAAAERFPSISLTATLSGSSEDLADVIDPENMLWNAMASVTAPIFMGGRLKAASDIAESNWLVNVSSYKLTALNAFKDVHNALNGGMHEKKRLQQLEELVNAAEASLRLATDQYLQGLTSYLQVVLAQSAYHNAQQNLISSKRNFIDYRIQLAVALGGGWTEEILESLVSDN